MNITGKVIQVAIDVDVKKKDGGTYKGWKLVYEQSDGEVKTIQKHMNSLKYAAPLANGLKELNAGDTFTMEMEKEGDFWNPKSVFKSEPGATGLKGAEDPKYKAAQQAKTASSSNSTYKSAEERAADFKLQVDKFQFEKDKQAIIVRQSSITSALKLLELQGNKKADVPDVLTIASRLEGWVLGKQVDVPGNTPNKEVTKVSNDTTFEDDIPF